MPAPAYADSATEVRFGYTLSDINRLANAAVWRGVFQKSLPLSERLDIAWSAIAEHLSACDEKPEPGKLIKAAWRELQSEAEANWHTHGVSRSTSVYGGEHTMPGFTRYWFTRNTQGPEEQIVEHIAFGQIWGALSETHKTLIAALAATDDYGKAAGALGKTRQSYVTHLSQARQAFRKLWHEGEKPSRHWGTDRRRNPDANYNKTPSRTQRGSGSNTQAEATRTRPKPATAGRRNR